MTAQLSQFLTVSLPDSRTLLGLSVELARSRFDRQRALELHRDVYRRKGLLREDTLTPQVLPQACAPGSAIFVAKEYGAIVGTISFYMDSVIGLPMDDVHGEQVGDMAVPYRVAILVGVFFDPNLDDKRVYVKFGRPIFMPLLRWLRCQIARS